MSISGKDFQYLHIEQAAKEEARRRMYQQRKKELFNLGLKEGSVVLTNIGKETVVGTDNLFRIKTKTGRHFSPFEIKKVISL